jgi:twitching motility protein PilI
MNAIDPFELLLDLERRALEVSAGLPTVDRNEEEWVGVGFRIGNSKLIASMSDVKEILHVPEYTLVPGVKSWIVGVANVRGSLLPIMDMKGYLLGEEIKQRQKGRVIVIDYKGFPTGLVVEEIYGMRHFREGEATEDIPEVNEVLTPFIERAFKANDEHWPVFSFNQMTQDERFSHASI